MELKFHTYDISITLQLQGKFNVVIGDSGIGKTYLTKLAESIRSDFDLRKEQPAPICGNRDLVRSWAGEYEGAVLILDEGPELEVWRQLIPVMEKSNNYYIICSREGDVNIPYGLSTTFRLERTHKSLRMVPAYTLSNINTTMHPVHFDSVITEDSKSGHLVAKERTALPVVPAGGKDKLPNAVLNTAGCPLVLADLCGIGATWERLHFAIQNTQAVLYHSASFEHEVCTRVFPGAEFPFYPKVCLQYNSEEEYYVSVLNSLMRQYCGLFYSKSNAEIAQLLARGKGIVGDLFVDLAEHGGRVERLYPFLSKQPSQGLNLMSLNKK